MNLSNTPTLTLHPLQIRAIENNTNLLRAINGVQFIVLMPDGTQITHGDLVLAPTKAVTVRQRRGSVFPIGAYTSHLKAVGLDSLPVGEVMVIDPAPYPIESIRTGACNYAIRIWGKDSLTTTLRNGLVEVMRLV